MWLWDYKVNNVNGVTGDDKVGDVTGARMMCGDV